MHLVVEPAAIDTRRVESRRSSLTILSINQLIAINDNRLSYALRHHFLRRSLRPMTSHYDITPRRWLDCYIRSSADHVTLGYIVCLYTLLTRRRCVWSRWWKRECASLVKTARHSVGNGARTRSAAAAAALVAAGDDDSDGHEPHHSVVLDVSARQLDGHTHATRCTTFWVVAEPLVRRFANHT